MAVEYGNKNTSDNWGEKAYIDCSTSNTGDTFVFTVKAGIQASTKAISISSSDTFPDRVYVELAARVGDGVGRSDTQYANYNSNSASYSLSKGSSRQHISKVWTWEESKEGSQTLNVCVNSGVQWLYMVQNPYQYEEGSSVYFFPKADSSNSSIIIKTFTIPQKSNYTVQFNANAAVGEYTGTVPESITKWHNEAITLPNNTLTRPGYDFVGWGTASTGGTIYQEGASYNGNGSQSGATITLYAIWQSNYVAPTISNLVAYRSDSEGNASDDDTYARIKFNYTEPEKDHAIYSIYMIQVLVKGSNEQFYHGRIIDISNIGTVDVIYDNIASEYAYDVLTRIIVTHYKKTTDTSIDNTKTYYKYNSQTGQYVVVTNPDVADIDSYYEFQSSNSVTKSTYITEAYYVMDINADGTAVSFFTAATETGALEIKGNLISINALLQLETNTSSGTDYEIYSAIQALNWNTGDDSVIV